jgi:aspartate racemase
MKTIGIIGGLGPESTLDYYKGIIRAVQEDHPEKAYPEIIVYSADLNAFIRLMEQQEWPKITGYLVEKIKALADAGAEFAAIASNTPHAVFDEVSARSPIPLLSIVEETCKKAMHMRLKKIGFMGTKFTMEADFYKIPFVGNGMEIVVPGKSDRALIHERLFSEIELGIIKDSTRGELLGIVKKMIETEAIDALILGCTELPLILTKDEFGIPFLNTTAIHIERIVAYSLQA